MLFTVKKWDESGNVTHVCKIREELRVNGRIRVPFYSLQVMP